MISRQDAKAQGLKRYFTGKPCKFGHVAERFVGCHSCQECKNLAQIARYSNDEKFRKRTLQARKSRTSLERQAKKSQRDATRAAALLTETLGVPHVVVETVDPKTGRKDWQPKPNGELE